MASSSDDSDRDEALDEDMEALRRACLLTGNDPASAFDDSDSGSDSGGSSSGIDDVGLLRRLQERFPSSSSAVELPPFIKPLCARHPQDSDEEDDFEILRAIQRRFSSYENDPLRRTSGSSVLEAEVIGIDMSGPDTPKNYRAVSEEYLGSASTEACSEENEACTLNAGSLAHSQFPKSAQIFVDVIKKNRSCQKFIRRKLIEIEAKIEENKDLKERVRCLMEFHIACKRRVGHILSQKNDPRVRLISVQKPREAHNHKTTCKKLPALCFGPAENSHVSKYKMVLKQFPLSLHKHSWSNKEKEKLAKGIKQQYQEMLLLRSMDVQSNEEGLTGSGFMVALSASDFEVTPEQIRSFLPLVNWDRLASMYLPGRSGEECKARWLNCDDPLINNNPWTVLEDKKLLFIVQERGVYNWINISIALGTHRTPFQCLARYQRSLNPHILNKDWTEDEDIKLRAAVETFGDENWQLVASNLEGRTGPQCSNRWRKSLIPGKRKVGRWSVDEDKRLKVAVMLFGAKNWYKIAQFAPGRTQVQCRERWHNCLDPSLNLHAWSAEEDSKLLDAISEHGYCWSKIATCIPGRTDSQCRRRWKVLLPHEVPLLQAARQVKRTALISNFVDRESERPLIGPNDFTPLLNPEVINTAVKKTSSDKPKNARVKSKKALKGNSSADGVVESSPGISNDSALVCGSDSHATAGGNIKRSRTTTSRGRCFKKLASKSQVEEKLTAGGIVNSSGDTSHANVSLVHNINTDTPEDRNLNKKRRKTSSGNSDVANGSKKRKRKTNIKSKSSQVQS
ncbi:uncharacterized protein [Typha angustifolia]|uniref:uncharacterized protein isoform X1 n=1 Tax=Typha angustifolia TaxID=59011 RepID=UPI003C30C9A7